MRRLFKRDQQREIAPTTVHEATRDERDSADGLALGSLGNLAELSGQQIENALSRIETANNWSFTLVSGAAIGISAQNGFPSAQSLILLCATTGLMGHFVVRAMKGYANVTRWYIILGIVSSMLLDDSDSRARRLPGLREHVDQYVRSWLLPVRRRAVWRKIFGEFSFGYVYLALTWAIGWVGFKVQPPPTVWMACAAILLVGPVELAVFNWRHPYMKKATGAPFKGAWRWQQDRTPE